MTGLQALDMAIGIIFIYLILSLACTAANEIIAGLFDLRAENLKTGIRNLLTDSFKPGLEDRFYDHPMIRNLSRHKSKGKKPSYITPRTFRLVLLDLVAPAEGDGSRKLENIRRNIERLPDDSSIRKTLLILLNDAEDDPAHFHFNIEEWYNNSMDRVSGWYKRKTQIVTVILAFVVSFGFNADTFQIARSLANNPAMRQAIVQQARETVKNHQALSEHDFKEIKAALDKTGLPFGWKNGEVELLKKGDFASWLAKLAGLLITTLAISLGAPFWFDTLNKIANIRSTGPTEKTEQRDHA